MSKNSWTCLLAGLALACGGEPTGPSVEVPATPPGPSNNNPSAAPALVPKVVGIQAGNNQAAIVGTATPEGLAVWVVDGTGKVMPGVPVTFEVSSGGGWIADAKSFTTSAGVAGSGKWTLGKTPGNNTVVARVDGTTLSVSFGATGTVVPRTGPVSAGIATGNAQTAVSGSAAPAGLAIWVKDVNGNTMSGVPVTFSVTGGGGSIADGNSVTTSAGIASSGKWTLGPTPGANTAVARVDGTEISVAFTATGTTAVPVPASIGVQAGNGQTAVAGSATPAGLAVWVTNANGSVMPNVPVTFTVTGGGGSIADAKSTTASGGVATSGKWTLGSNPGANTVAATVDGYNVSVTFTATGTPVPSPVASSISIASGNSQSAQAGRGIRSDITLMVKDGNGNPFPNASISLSAGNGGAISPSSVTTNSSGIAKLRGWTLGPLTGTQTLTARVTTGSINPSVGISATAATMRIVTFGDSNTDRGYAGAASAFSAVSYISMNSPRPSSSAANDGTQLAGKIEAQWRAKYSAAVTAVNHGISSTTSGSIRQATGAPGALTVVNGITRYDAEMLGAGALWNGGEPASGSYSGPIVRARSYVPTALDFGYISLGTNDQTNLISTAQTISNLTVMIDKWIAKGLPPDHLIITTLAPAPGVGSATIPALNANIRSLALQKGVKLIDIAAYVSDTDGLTWKSAAYFVPDGTDAHYVESVRDWIASQVVSIAGAVTAPR